MAFVEFKDVTKVYHSGEIEIKAVDGISFSIEEGEFAVIVGPSGAGKTTVLNILGGMDTCTGGSVLVNGTDISKFKERQLTEYRRNDIGFVFQFYNLVQNLTALENVELPLIFSEYPENRRREAAAEVLDQVGLGDRMHHRPSELSGGQQQRVSIARALVTRPKVILADEPTGNLDSHTGSEIMELLHRINQENNSTFLIVTHDRELADSCDRSVFLRDGLIVGEGEL